MFTNKDLKKGKMTVGNEW